MNYEKHYHLLIEKAGNRGWTKKSANAQGIYVEQHHVIPKCVAPDLESDPNNIVTFLPEEHYLAHQLLLKIYHKNYDLIYAAKMMTCNSPKFKGNRSKNKLYGWLRKRFAKAMGEREFTPEHRRKLSEANKGKSGRPGKQNGMYGKIGHLNHRFGTKHTESTKNLMSDKAKQRFADGFQEHRKGVPRTDEVKKKISENHKKFDYTVKCPHCDKEGKYLGMRRWHFDNCRFKL